MNNVHLLDLEFRGRRGTIAAYLLECGHDELALIETGPGSTLMNLLKGIRELGFQPEQIKHVFVTHVHLDHAGAAGWWAQQGAMVYAHPRAVPHLVDPSKLILSAQQVYGDKMDEYWGPMLACPHDQVKVLEDGERVSIGDRIMVAHDTPGHARHHHVYVLENEGIGFTGDVAGVRLQGFDYVSVAAAPPQFDVEAYESSIHKLQRLNLNRLYLTHFGPVNEAEVASHLQMELIRVRQVFHSVGSMVRAGYEPPRLRRMFEERERMFAGLQGVVNDEDWELYQIANHTDMNTDGIALYCHKTMKTDQ